MAKRLAAAVFFVSCVFARSFSFPVGFSGGIGGILCFGHEFVKSEGQDMTHKAAGAQASLFVTAPVKKFDVGIWTRLAYLTPYYYYLDSGDEFSGESDLTYVFTEMLDFSVGCAGVFNFTDVWALSLAAGFDISQMIYSPRISYSFGMAFDLSLRATFARNIAINVGAAVPVLFSMKLTSAALEYRHRYCFAAFEPYVSIGFNCKAEK